jgi:hypothetical protein
MAELVTLKRALLDGHHLRPGRTRHTISDAKGTRDFPPFVRLDIAKSSEDVGYFLNRIAENGQVADTWHMTLDEAVEQAEFEFGVAESEWMDIESSGA